MVKNFHADKRKLNPYVPCAKKCTFYNIVTRAIIYLFCADRTPQEVQNDLIESERTSLSTESSATISFASYVTYGLELEDAQ